MKISKIFLLSLITLSLSLRGMDQDSLDKKLLRAAEDGDVQRTERLLKRGANINASYDHGDTALILAASDGNVEIVRLLLDQKDPKVNINAADEYGDTALREASWLGNVEIVRLLLGQKNPKVNINAANKYGITALMRAVLWGNIKTVRLLLNAMSKGLNEPLNPELIEFIEVDIKKALKRINLRDFRSIECLKAFHIFARQHPKEFPGLEKEINQLMNQALVRQNCSRRKEAFEKMVKYQRASR